MPAGRLKKYLDSHKIDYKTINHPVAFSALQLCEVTHIPSKHMAKTVVCKTPRSFFMVVLHADEQVDMQALGRLVHEQVSLASQDEFANVFPDCEVGAMPPFGNLYEMDVYVSDTLKNDKEITFNAGNHSELYKMSYKDFEKLVHPRVAHLVH